MNAGDRQTFQCDSCSKEFDIVYEAKLETATEREKEQTGIDPAEVNHCPFCGEHASAC